MITASRNSDSFREKRTLQKKNVNCRTQSAGDSSAGVVQS